MPIGERRPGIAAWLVAGLLALIVLAAVAWVGLEDWDAFRLLRQGDRYYRQGRFDQGAEAYRRALEMDPRSAAAHHRLGLCLEGQGDAEGAIEHYREAVRLDAGLARAHDDLAALLVDRGQYAAAVEALRTGLAQVPDAPRMTQRLVGLLAACPEDGVRNGAEAVRIAERQVAATGRQDAAWLDLLAGAYAEAGRFEQARQAAREAVAAASSPEQAREIRARLTLYEAGRPYRMPGGRSR